MKLLRNILLLCALCTTIAFMTLQKKTRIIFFGDSITQKGVSPKGYISLLATMLKAQGRDSLYELIGAGVSANKVYDLYLRMDQDVLAKKPNVVVIWIGVNDVWHKATHGTGTDPDKYRIFYEAIIRKLQLNKIKVFIVTPGMIGEKTDFSNQQDGDLNFYAGIVRKLAVDCDCGLIDLRKDFLQFNVKNNPDNKEFGILTTDRVHLSDKGNLYVAQRMFNAILAK